MCQRILWVQFQCPFSGGACKSDSVVGVPQTLVHLVAVDGGQTDPRIGIPRVQREGLPVQSN